MTPEGHNDLFPALEHILRDADQPLDCNQLFDMQAVRAIAPLQTGCPIIWASCFAAGC